MQNSVVCYDTFKVFYKCVYPEIVPVILSSEILTFAQV